LTELISPDPRISLRRQCALLEVCRGSYYYQCCPETEENLALMRRLDEMHLQHPVYGSRKLTALLRREGLVLTQALEWGQAVRLPSAAATGRQPG
jgi:putative transposase